MAAKQPAAARSIPLMPHEMLKVYGVDDSEDDDDIEITGVEIPGEKRGRGKRGGKKKKGQGEAQEGNVGAQQWNQAAQQWTRGNPKSQGAKKEGQGNQWQDQGNQWEGQGNQKGQGRQWQNQGNQWQGQGNQKEGPGSQKQGQGNQKQGQGKQWQSQGNEKQDQGNQKQGRGNQWQGQGNQKQGKGKQWESQANEKQGQGNQKQGRGNQWQGQGSQKQGVGNQWQGQGNQKQGQGTQKQGQGNQWEGQGNQKQGQGKPWQSQGRPGNQQRSQGNQYNQAQGKGNQHQNFGGQKKQRNQQWNQDDQQGDRGQQQDWSKQGSWSEQATVYTYDNYDEPQSNDNNGNQHSAQSRSNRNQQSHGIPGLGYSESSQQSQSWSNQKGDQSSQMDTSEATAAGSSASLSTVLNKLFKGNMSLTIGDLGHKPGPTGRQPAPVMSDFSQPSSSNMTNLASQDQKSNVHCDVCDVGFANTKQYNVHCSGFMHTQKLVDKEKEEALKKQKSKEEQEVESMAKTLGIDKDLPPLHNLGHRGLHGSKPQQNQQSKQQQQFQQKQQQQTKAQQKEQQSQQTQQQPQQTQQQQSQMKQQQSQMKQQLSQLQQLQSQKSEVSQPSQMPQNVNQGVGWPKPKPDPKPQYPSTDLLMDVDTPALSSVLGFEDCKLCSADCNTKEKYKEHMTSVDHALRYLEYHLKLGHKGFVDCYGKIPWLLQEPSTSKDKGTVPPAIASALAERNYEPLLQYRSGHLNKFLCRMCGLDTGGNIAWLQHHVGQKHKKKCDALVKSMGINSFMNRFWAIPGPHWNIMATAGVRAIFKLDPPDYLKKQLKFKIEPKPEPPQLTPGMPVHKRKPPVKSLLDINTNRIPIIGKKFGRDKPKLMPETQARIPDSMKHDIWAELLQQQHELLQQLEHPHQQQSMGMNPGGPGQHSRMGRDAPLEPKQVFEYGHSNPGAVQDQRPSPGAVPYNPSNPTGMVQPGPAIIPGMEQMVMNPGALPPPGAMGPPMFLPGGVPFDPSNPADLILPHMLSALGAIGPPPLGIAAPLPMQISEPDMSSYVPGARAFGSNVGTFASAGQPSDIPPASALNAVSQLAMYDIAPMEQPPLSGTPVHLDINSVKAETLFWEMMEKKQPKQAQPETDMTSRIIERKLSSLRKAIADTTRDAKGGGPLEDVSSDDSIDGYSTRNRGERDYSQDGDYERRRRSEQSDNMDKDQCHSSHHRNRSPSRSYSQHMDDEDAEYDKLQVIYEERMEGWKRYYQQTGQLPMSPGGYRSPSSGRSHSRERDQYRNPSPGPSTGMQFDNRRGIWEEPKLRSHPSPPRRNRSPERKTTKRRDTQDGAGALESIRKAVDTNKTTGSKTSDSELKRSESSRKSYSKDSKDTEKKVSDSIFDGATSQELERKLQERRKKADDERRKQIDERKKNDELRRKHDGERKKNDLERQRIEEEKKKCAEARKRLQEEKRQQERLRKEQEIKKLEEQRKRDEEELQKRQEELRRKQEELKIKQEEELKEKLRKEVEERQRIQEEKRKELAKLEELRRQEEERLRQAEEKRRLEQERRKEEERRKELERIAREEEMRRQEEERQREEERRLEEQMRLAEERRLEEQRRFEEQKRLDEQRRLEEQMRLEEQKRLDEQMRLEEQMKIEEERRLEEARMIEEQLILEEERLRGVQRIGGGELEERVMWGHDTQWLDNRSRGSHQYNRVVPIDYGDADIENRHSVRDPNDTASVESEESSKIRADLLREAEKLRAAIYERKINMAHRVESDPELDNVSGPDNYSDISENDMLLDDRSRRVRVMNRRSHAHDERSRREPRASSPRSDPHRSGRKRTHQGSIPGTDPRTDDDYHTKVARLGDQDLQATAQPARVAQVDLPSTSYQDADYRPRNDQDYRSVEKSEAPDLTAPGIGGSFRCGVCLKVLYEHLAWPPKSQVLTDAMQAAIQVFQANVQEFLIRLKDHSQGDELSQTPEEVLRRLSDEERLQAIAIRDMTGIEDVGRIVKSLGLLQIMPPEVVETLGSLNPTMLKLLGDSSDMSEGQRDIFNMLFGQGVGADGTEAPPMHPSETEPAIKPAYRDRDFDHRQHAAFDDGRPLDDRYRSTSHGSLDERRNVDQDRYDRHREDRQQYPEQREYSRSDRRRDDREREYDDRRRGYEDRYQHTDRRQQYGDRQTQQYY